ncbi:MAG: hypothetical protein SCK70_04860 [bacterium]|nr:hypothetical protein [bacterium]
MNYSAIAPGERDFFQGVDFLTEMQNKYQLAFVNANILQPDGLSTFFKPYIIKTLEGFSHKGKQIPSLRVGILGLLFKRLQLVINKDEPQLMMTDPIEAAQAIVPEMKDQCDIIIALAHIRYPQIKSLAEAVSDIDVIVGTHDPIYRLNPETYNGAITITCGNQGQYIGDLKIDFDKNKNIIHHSGGLVLLGNEVDDDPGMKMLVAEFKQVKSRQVRTQSNK